MEHEDGPAEQLAKFRAALDELGWHSDLGISVKLPGGPGDAELLRAAGARDYDSVRRLLLDRPFDLARASRT